MRVPRKYGFLRLVAFLLKLLAWSVLLAGLAVALLGVGLGAASAVQIPEWLRAAWVGGIIAAPVLAIVWFVQLFACGSILSLLVDIEENTRALAARPDAPPPTPVA
jgi:hypothetical protein